MNIKLNQPITPDLKKLSSYLKQVNDNGWYTNFGPLHKLLTQRLEAYLGVENLLLVSNGTLALQVAYKTLDVKNALTTPFSFVATASSLIWQDIETSFSDIDSESYNLCPEKAQRVLDENSDIDTIVATHVYGNPCDVTAFDKLAEKNKIKIIYDAAHAFGVNVGERSVLSFGDASTLSFHATKVFHTVEGGAIVFKNRSDFERAKRLVNFGMDEDGNILDVGINAKLNEYQCAVGLTVLDGIEKVIKHRENMFKLYQNELEGYVKLPKWHTQATLTGAYMPVVIEDTLTSEKVVDRLKESGIQSRRYFSPSLDLAFKNQTSYGCDLSQKSAKEVICLPLHYYISTEDVYIVTRLIKEALK
ncbi:aminotransferase DegT [Vibrio splendidus]|uniref:DegT/DnrJ/EryC1/StrS family aminotransferase n=1 Tax=Vibrio splendidus TaxID=29497 RepID=UPI000D3CC5C9|nr:DegT/DnrJ/EryC1/StrS family aminotransferase [Vibrio splendidus]PTO51475.1 aminotransferase DegT [Vibrio splendidus]